MGRFAPIGDVLLFAMTTATLDVIKDGLKSCGFTEQRMRSKYRFSTSNQTEIIPLACFAHEPFDVRSACIGVTSVNGNAEHEIARLRDLGAPVLFGDDGKNLQWWRFQGQTPVLFRTVPHKRLPSFFDQEHENLSPHRIYRAKTLGGLQASEQLEFIDVGLLPVVEGEIGYQLSRLVTRMLEQAFSHLSGEPSADKSKAVFRTVFQLLTAKILRDKRIKEFEALDLADWNSTLRTVAQHYGECPAEEQFSKRWRKAFDSIAAQLATFSDFGNLSTESLGYVYEHALVSRSLRKQLGIHSTPPYLVDYILGRLAPWIEEIPKEKLRVFEPACGHAPFLVSALRLIKETVFFESQRKRSEFLRDRLCGMDTDDFALQLARLSLTLADAPNPNGWKLKNEDIFTSGDLSHYASEATVLLINPPYEDFTLAERQMYRRPDGTKPFPNKAYETLHRTLRLLPEGGVFGLVLKQGFLHSKQSKALREFLLTRTEIQEICTFPDRVFTFSDMETTTVIGRRCRVSRPVTSNVRYRRIRYGEIRRFVRSYESSSEDVTTQIDLPRAPTYDFRVPELIDLWKHCKDYPQLGEISTIGKGLEHIGLTYRDSATIVASSTPFAGSHKGFARFHKDVMTHETPPYKYLNTDSNVVRSPGLGLDRGEPQILINYARVSRGPWRLKAFVDRRGHPFTTRFVAVRPNFSVVDLEFLWALCNSPLSNAYMFSFCLGRDNLVERFKRIPVPNSDPPSFRHVSDLVREYFALFEGPAASQSETPLPPSPLEVLLKIDACLLRMFDFPPRLEKRLLDFFRGEQRAGVPFEFKSYYPPDFKPAIPLHLYLSSEFQESTAGQFRDRWKPGELSSVIEALDFAVEAYR